MTAKILFYNVKKDVLSIFIVAKKICIRGFTRFYEQIVKKIRCFSALYALNNAIITSKTRCKR